MNTHPTVTITELDVPVQVPDGALITHHWQLEVNGETFGSGAPSEDEARANAAACAASHGYTPDQIKEHS